MAGITVLDSQTVGDCLPMTTCIKVMADTLVSLYRKEVILPQRVTTSLADTDKLLMTMPGAIRVLH